MVESFYIHNLTKFPCKRKKLTCNKWNFVNMNKLKNTTIKLEGNKILRRKQTFKKKNMRAEPK